MTYGGQAGINYQEVMMLSDYLPTSTRCGGRAMDLDQSQHWKSDGRMMWTTFSRRQIKVSPVISPLCVI